MRLSSTIIRWARSGLRNPSRILPFIKDKLVPYTCYIGDGSWAYPPTEVKMYVNSDTDKSHCISVDDCCRLMEDVKSYNPRINICGPEPLLNDKILDILTVIKTHRLNTKLCTNGVLLPEMAEQIACIGVDSVWVSLDGIQPIHDRIWGEGVYQKAISGIRLLRSSRGRYGKKIPRIAINFHINHMNYHNIVEFCELMFQKEKVDYINLIHPYFVPEAASKAHDSNYAWLGAVNSRSVKDLELDKIKTNVLWTQLERLKHKAWSRKISFNIDIATKEQLHNYYHRHEKAIKRNRCYLPWSKTTVLANGDVIVSSRCFSFKTGNFHEQSLKEIWNGERYKTFRKKLKETGCFPTCSRCGSLKG